MLFRFFETLVSYVRVFLFISPSNSYHLCFMNVADILVDAQIFITFMFSLSNVPFDILKDIC